MKGWQIFWQSVLRVFNNLGAAIRVSLVPYVIIAVAFVALLLPVMGIIFDQQAMNAAVQAGTFPWGSFIAVVIVAVIGGLWIAVAWHRYILLDEAVGIVPPFKFDRILAYFLRGLLIAIILIVFAIVLSLVAGLIAVPIAMNAKGVTAAILGAAIFGVIVLVPTYVVAMRLSASLPGAAVGAEKGIGDAWRATSGNWGSFIVLAIIFLVVGWASGYVSTLLAGNDVLLLIWTIVYGWVSAMVGVSVLTTLYGHYIEGRALE